MLRTASSLARRPAAGVGCRAGVGGLIGLGWAAVIVIERIRRIARGRLAVWGASEQEARRATLPPPVQPKPRALVAIG